MSLELRSRGHLTLRFSLSCACSVQIVLVESTIGCVANGYLKDFGTFNFPNFIVTLSRLLILRDSSASFSFESFLMLKQFSDLFVNPFTLLLAFGH
jgi:hypothetical protein